MDEKKRKRIEKAEEAALRRRNDELGRKLQQRIAYHEAKLREEREQRARKADRPLRFGLFRP